MSLYNCRVISSKFKNILPHFQSNRGLALTACAPRNKLHLSSTRHGIGFKDHQSSYNLSKIVGRFSQVRNCSASTPAGEGLPQDVVYLGDMTVVVKLVKRFSLSTSIFGILAQPMLYKSMATLHTAILVSFGTVFCFFTYCTPFMLHYVLKRYVVKMQFNPETKKFTATTLTFLGFEDIHEFKAEDVHVPDFPGAFTSVIAKGKPLLINYKLFKDPDVYSHMMGYDKPIDIKLK